MVTTLWKVDDRASYELMREFYARLEAAGPAVALRGAQRTVMREFGHPFARAAFGLTGVPWGQWPWRCARPGPAASEGPGVSAREGSAALALSGVSRTFGGLRAVDGVSLEVRQGERRAIIGPNGAGKTTLFNLISGELPPSEGRITLFGHDVTRLPPHRRAALGLGRTYQITNLFPRLTVLDNCLLAAQGLSPVKLHLHRGLHHYPALFDRARQAMRAVGLHPKEEETVRNLSHGEQRQLEIALALAGGPKLLLLDEPTAGLSPAESQAMAALLRTLDPAITVLIIEHDMDVAFALTDRITVLHFGKVVAEGVGEAVKADPLVQEIYLGTDSEESARARP